MVFGWSLVVSDGIDVPDTHLLQTRGRPAKSLRYNFGRRPHVQLLNQARRRSTGAPLKLVFRIPAPRACTCMHEFFFSFVFLISVPHFEMILADLLGWDLEFARGVSAMASVVAACRLSDVSVWFTSCLCPLRTICRTSWSTGVTDTVCTPCTAATPTFASAGLRIRIRFFVFGPAFRNDGGGFVGLGFGVC